jgi:large subunit ribosomal protein L9
MKVILLEYVYKHGVAGEVIDVADGFARNYLIPSRRAVKATEGELKRAKRLREQAALKRAQLDDQLNELASKIDGVELVFGRRAATTGKLFGSVTTQELAEELMKATGIDINRRRISQAQIRDVGTHLVPVRMGNEISPNLKVTVVREEELKEFLAKRAAAEKAATEGVEVDNVAAEAETEAAAEGTDSATAE